MLICLGRHKPREQGASTVEMRSLRLSRVGRGSSIMSLNRKMLDRGRQVALMRPVPKALFSIRDVVMIA